MQESPQRQKETNQRCLEPHHITLRPCDAAGKSVTEGFLEEGKASRGTGIRGAKKMERSRLARPGLSVSRQGVSEAVGEQYETLQCEVGPETPAPAA